MSTENADNTESHPSWLNLEFFHSILRNNRHLPSSSDSLCVKSINVEPATAIGDNYMSSIYRVIIEYTLHRDTDEKNTLSLVVKVLPDSGPIEEIIEKYNAFPKEIKIYSEIIPALEEIWQRAGHSVQFGPKCWFTSETPRSVIVMDDLKAIGYGMLPRQKGLTIEETKTLLTKLAKFHSASVIHYDENGPYDNLFNEGIARMDVREGMEQYYGSMYAGLMEMLESSDFALPYLPKLRKWKNRIFETNYRLTLAEDNSFNVLNHGDSWTNNLMFRHQHGTPEVLLVDFQLSSWTSPAIDLIYLLFNACNSDDFFTHFDQLIQFYYSELKRDFELLQKPEKIPKFEEINSAIHRKGFFGAMFIVESIPIMRSDPDVKVNLDLIVDEHNEEGQILKRKIFSSELVKRIYKRLLPFLDERNFLDIPE
ncbi:uncharacterized protein LOC132264677 [Phlebotomus argentipes]|uniref:uncharacterized protein LOC132264677 n=1 Tax=Phlebotomus argentipes TaxID=94469 RepID=UPI00289337DF|nr:uncharacterized protein LOC132264677 [Phlebotomus argentipes]